MNVCFFPMALTRFLLFRLKLKWLKNGGAKVFIVTCIFFRMITFIKSFYLELATLKMDLFEGIFQEHY